METYLNAAQIVLAIALIVIVLLQVRGGGLGGIFGTASPVYRTRRGLEKTLFQLTIAIAAVFIVIALLRFNL